MRTPAWRRAAAAGLGALVLLLSPGLDAWAAVARVVPIRVRAVAPAVAPLALQFHSLPRAWGGMRQPRLLGQPALSLPVAPRILPAALSPDAVVPTAIEANAVIPESSLQSLSIGNERITEAATTGERRSELDRLFVGARRHAASEVATAATETGAPIAALPRPETAEKSAPGVPAPGDFNKKAVLSLFFTRTLSITAFVLTSIAYPFVAAPAVGWALYGTLMSLGPLIAIATGPLNGAIADKLSARNSMVINMAVRAVLALTLPAFSWFGVLNFWTLLVSSVANGWILSSTMTTENAYIRRLAGKHQEAVSSLGAVHYVGMQVLLGLIIGVGSVVDKYNPLAAFLISAAVHGLLILPILWFTMPNDAPQARASENRPRPAAGEFVKKYVIEIALLLCSLALYAVTQSTMPIAAALFYWVLRTKTVRDLRGGLMREVSAREAQIAARLAELEGQDGSQAEIAALQAEVHKYKRRQFRALLYHAGQAILTYPLQNFALPLIAVALVGASGKALFLGKLMGAVFFGNLISNSSQISLPDVRIPFTHWKAPGQRIVQSTILGLAAAWIYTSLVPGSILAAILAAGAAAGLMALAGRISRRGWIKFLGVGLAAVWLPYLAWTGVATFVGVQTALFFSMLIYGMFTGPAAVSFTIYTQDSSRRADLGKVFGVGSSFFNTFNSFGYGLLTLAAGCFNPVFPSLLLPILLAYAAASVVFWRATGHLPDLPESVFKKRG
jgi:MFS family permease